MSFADMGHRGTSTRKRALGRLVRGFRQLLSAGADTTGD